MASDQRGAEEITAELVKLSVAEHITGKKPGRSDRRGSVTPSSTVHKARRRLSVVDGAVGTRLTRIDGAEGFTSPGLEGRQLSAYIKEQDDGDVAKNLFESEKPKPPFSSHASLGQTGYVPFNPEKVNQDRPLEVESFGGDVSKALFGAFDGHGSLGHEVSTFVSGKLPNFILKQEDLAKDVHAALKRAFVECNAKLASSKIDCTFSGTTGVAVYLDDQKLYCANTGDSRAVLAQKTEKEGEFTAIDLSDDQKPEREDEAKRIRSCRGRVEACKSVSGQDIGPLRVWLQHQDVPGLAMTRSFGDLIAASVGVIPEPEVLERDRSDKDAYMILASDGVWEFISSQQAVDLIKDCKSAEEACKVLVDESTRLWKHEEEVIDDITAVVVYF